MYKVEVIADTSGKWAGNGLTFESTTLAIEYAQDLFMRWTSVLEWRVVDDQGRPVAALNVPY